MKLKNITHYCEDIGKHFMDISKLIVGGAVLSPIIKDGFMNMSSILLWLTVSTVAFICGIILKNLNR
jgi:hypothetical protein